MQIFSRVEEVRTLFTDVQISADLSRNSPNTSGRMDLAGRLSGCDGSQTSAMSTRPASTKHLGVQRRWSMVNMSPTLSRTVFAAD